MAITLDLVHSVSDADLLALSARNPGYQIERTTGGRLVVSPAGTEGGRRSGELFLQVAAWNRGALLGVALDSSPSFSLPDGSCLSPDAAWVRRERWDVIPRQAREGFAPLCPDVAFEVRSKSDVIGDLREKMRAYLANGARVAVLVDPDARTVEVHRPGAQPDRFDESERVAFEPEMPGFVLDPRPVFGDW